MKTKAKSKIKSAAARRRATRGRKASGPRGSGSVENRDLNEDEQDQITNVNRDDDLADQGNPSYTGFSVEEEKKGKKEERLRTAALRSL